jgi:hypothetical protein
MSFATPSLATPPVSTTLVPHTSHKERRDVGSLERVDRPKPWRAVYRGPDGRKHSKSFARKVDAERWLKVSEAEALTGQWVDPTAGAKLFGPYAEEWIAYKRSAVGETTATSTESQPGSESSCRPAEPRIRTSHNAPKPSQLSG